MKDINLKFEQVKNWLFYPIFFIFLSNEEGKCTQKDFVLTKAIKYDFHGLYLKVHFSAYKAL